LPAQERGPHIRLACSFRRFARFEHDLNTLLANNEPALTLYGSGDFHHVSLALVRRLTTPVNLLVIDNHPDWMRGVPFLHCGTWLYHAAQLSHVERVFHVGGDVDFDNYYWPLAPWRLLYAGKISVIPGVRRFTRGGWRHVRNTPLRSPHQGDDAVAHITQVVESFNGELTKRPLYISLDKDVMSREHAVVNWDSGHLTLAEVQTIIDVFVRAAGGDLAGMDIVGEWSEVRVRGLLGRSMHWTMHPVLTVDSVRANGCNERTNLTIFETVRAAQIAARSRVLGAA
jgi:arginase family enzyme